MVLEDKQQKMSGSRHEVGQAQATGRSRRRYKAKNMAFQEMVEMVTIFTNEDYDGKHGPYLHPNKVKADITDKVIRRLRLKFGERRSREQIRKRWSDLKKREPEQLRAIKRLIRAKSK